MNHNTLIKLAEFKALKQGWCYGEGVLIKEQTIEYATKLFYFLFEQGIAQTDAFPGVDGEVRATGYYDEHYLEFTVEKDDCITYLYELDDQEQIYLEGLTLSDAITNARKTITSIKSCQFLSDQYTKDIGISKRSDFKAWHSGRPVMAEFQYFVDYALSRPAVASVLTQQPSIKTSQTILRSIGSSTNPYCQAIIKSTKPQVRLETYVTGT